MIKEEYEVILQAHCIQNVHHFVLLHANAPLVAEAKESTLVVVENMFLSWAINIQEFIYGRK